MATDPQCRSEFLKRLDFRVSVRTGHGTRCGFLMRRTSPYRALPRSWVEYAIEPNRTSSARSAGLAGREPPLRFSGRDRHQAAPSSSGCAHRHQADPHSRLVLDRILHGVRPLDGLHEAIRPPSRNRGQRCRRRNRDLCGQRIPMPACPGLPSASGPTMARSPTSTCRAGSPITCPPSTSHSSYSRDTSTHEISDRQGLSATSARVRQRRSR